MRNLLYIILFSCCLTVALVGQDIHTVKKFSDELFNQGNYQAALKEYQRVIFFDKQNEYPYLYARIAEIHYRLSDFDNAIRYFELAQQITESDSIKFELTLEKALCYFKLDKYLQALNELYDLPDHSSLYLRDKKNLYLGICHFGLDDYASSLDYFSMLFHDEGLEEVNRLFSDFEDYRRKYRPGKVELMSMLLPGLGQIYTGQVFNGINSFLLVSGVTVYAVVTAVNYGLIDGLLVLSSWFLRYYSGGYTNARNFAMEKIDSEKTRVYSGIFTLLDQANDNTL